MSQEFYHRNPKVSAYVNHNYVRSGYHIQPIESRLGVRLRMGHTTRSCINRIAFAGEKFLTSIMAGPLLPWT